MMLRSLCLALVIGPTIGHTDEPVAAPNVLLEEAGRTGRDQHGDWLEVSIAGRELKFRKIKAGSFMMGSPKGESWHRKEHETQHHVTISQDFYILSTELTQSQWAPFVEATGYRTDPEKNGGVKTYNGEKWVKEKGKSWRNLFMGNDRPVVGVSWNDANAYCKWLTSEHRQAGLLPERYVYALPTEAQWEYCCRAGTTTSYCFGNTVNYDQANFRTYNNGRVGRDGGKEVKDKYRKETIAVGSFPANAWGIHDMHGNAWEWTRDWYGELSDQVATDPTGALEGKKRVLRGGGWRGVSQQGRSANRYMDHPYLGYSDLGFRLVLQKVSQPDA